jgi:hypothetical protein
LSRARSCDIRSGSAARTESAHPGLFAADPAAFRAFSNARSISFPVGAFTRAKDESARATTETVIRGTRYTSE